MKKQRTVLIVGGLVLLAGAASLLAYLRRQRKDPSACPYSLRFSLDLPHPFVTRPRLREMLSPEPGQKVLEIGPGTGYYALQAARWLEPGGILDILDMQQEMLDHTMHRAGAMGITNIVPRPNPCDWWLCDPETKRTGAVRPADKRTPLSGR